MNRSTRSKWKPEDEQAVIKHSVALLEQHIRTNGQIQKPDRFMLRTVQAAQKEVVPSERQRYMTQFKNIGDRIIQRLEQEGFPSPVTGEIKHPRKVDDVRVPQHKKHAAVPTVILPFSMQDIEQQLRNKIMGELFEEHCAPVFRQLRLNVKALTVHHAALSQREVELHQLANQIRSEWPKLLAQQKAELEATYQLLLEQATNGKLEIAPKPAPKLVQTPVVVAKPAKFSVVIIDPRCQQLWQPLVNDKVHDNIRVRYLHPFDNKAAHSEWFLDADRYVIALEHYNKDTVLYNTIRAMKMEQHRIVLFNKDEHSADHLAKLANEAALHSKRK